MTNTELRKASIFDLTNDKAVIEGVLGHLPEQKEYVQSATIEAKAVAMFDYAGYTKDNELVNQLTEVFENELALFFNE